MRESPEEKATKEVVTEEEKARIGTMARVGQELQLCGTYLER